MSKQRSTTRYRTGAGLFLVACLSLFRPVSAYAADPAVFPLSITPSADLAARIPAGDCALRTVCLTLDPPRAVQFIDQVIAVDKSSLNRIYLGPDRALMVKFTGRRLKVRWSF